MKLASAVKSSGCASGSWWKKKNLALHRAFLLVSCFWAFGAIYLQASLSEGNPIQVRTAFGTPLTVPLSVLDFLKPAWASCLCCGLEQNPGVTSQPSAKLRDHISAYYRGYYSWKPTLIPLHRKQTNPVPSSTAPSKSARHNGYDVADSSGIKAKYMAPGLYNHTWTDPGCMPTF